MPRADSSLLVVGALLGAGAASALTALATYFTRYSAFDSIEGEVPRDLYLAVTGMAPAEEAAFLVGAVLLAAGVVMLLGRLLSRLRPQPSSGVSDQRS